jgi:DNA-binding MarR family transcriptional regulator
MTTTGEKLTVADAFVRLSHLVQHVFADASRRHELTPQQAQLLCLLTRGPAGMTELSRLLHLEKSSLTGLVDRVERRGLVARARDARDRRACRIELTDQGTHLALACHEDVTTRLETLAGDLEPADRTHLVSIITRLLAAG